CPASATLGSTKCCAMHEWPLRRAASQHLELVMKGSNGPFVRLCKVHFLRIVDLDGRRSMVG
ncbi:hypothetical protein, partial [Celeribacter sp.]|uniref:hypothetical protein n=1 Tax=Celeribacter sp. TaxID=1890673 RepID=UPI003A8D060A